MILLKSFLNIKTAFIVIAMALTASCNDKKGKGDEVLAEYKDKTLLKSDIPTDILEKFREGDSTGLLKSFIDKWLEKQVLVDAATNSLTDEEKDKERLIEDYRNSLLIYEYEKKLVMKNIDTSVTEEEIKTFYDENLNTFQLKKNIVKIKYVKIGKQRADLGKLKRLIQSTSKVDDSLLHIYAEKEADNFYLDTNWLYLDDITKEIPLDANYDQQRFLSNNKFVQIEENDVLYLLYILDFRIKNAISPLAFERERIRDIILYKRRLTLLKSNKKTIFEKALNSGDIKYHKVK